MKKIISVILVLLMLAAFLLVNVTASTFKDVSDSAYYAEAAKQLAEKKILEGYPDGTFGPARFITRAEMSAIVCRMINLKLNTQNLKSPFTDVPDNHWAIPYIVAASNAKIINGDGDGTFRPEDNVKHEEAIKMVVCALNMVPADIVIDPVDWSAPYLKIADEKGISANVMGKKGERSTRGDVAVMVYNGIIPTVNPPKASVASGVYTSSKKVTLTSDTPGAKIYYSLNGETPNKTSVEYKEPITINKDCTLKAVAVFEGVTSTVLTVEYEINLSTGTGSSGNKDNRFDFEGNEDINSSNKKDDDDDDVGGNDNPGSDDEDKEASAMICEELGYTLEAIKLINFNGKAAEVIEYIERDIELTLDAAAGGVIITKEYVRITHNADITEVKAIIDSMSDDEKAEFKEEILKLDTYSLITLADFFGINTNYLG